MSLINAINTPEGEFIRGSFEAVVSNASSKTAKSGKTFWTATLTDGAETADAVSFDQTFEHDNGRRVEFSGMGLKRGENYNGKAKVVIGGKAKRKYLGGDAAPANATQSPAQSRQTPAAKHSEQTQAFSTKMTVEEMAGTWAAIQQATYAAYTKAGISGDEALAAARKAPEWAALWWFGERSVAFGGKPAAPSAATTVDESDVPF